jgi:phospholipase C
MGDPIEHVVVLMLENGSFDRLLGCMNSRYSNLSGPNEDKPNINRDYPDELKEIPQEPVDLYSVPLDPGHDLDDVLRQLDNNNTGFIADFRHHCPQAPETETYEIMGYYKKGALPVLHTLADNFLVCDHWFSSVPGPTWPNRFFVHSGTSLGHFDMPEGFFHPGIHLYDQPTVYQRLSERGISWRIYFGDVPQSLVMVRQFKYLDHYHRMERFYEDAAGPASSFPQYVFIEPSYFGADQNDAHPPTDLMQAEALLAKIYNAIRKNEELWKSALLVVLFDEHGGFYDHEIPLRQFRRMKTQRNSPSIGSVSGFPPFLFPHGWMPSASIRYSITPVY